MFPALNVGLNVFVGLEIATEKVSSPSVEASSNVGMISVFEVVLTEKLSVPLDAKPVKSEDVVEEWIIA